METISYFRVERGRQSFRGTGHGSESRHQQKRHQYNALVDAIRVADLSQARQILQKLFSLEPMLRSDPLFLKLGRALEENNVYAAEHFVKELGAKSLESLFRKLTSPSPAAKKPTSFGTSTVDFQA